MESTNNLMKYKYTYKYKMNIKNLILAFSVVVTGSFLVGACTSHDKEADAFGNIEAVEILVSSEGSGQIENLNIEEGDRLKQNQRVGVIDTMGLYLQKVEIQKSIEGIYAKLPDIVSEINVLKEKLANAELEQRRISSLFEAEAATDKQLDDINSLVKVIKKQITATTSSLNIKQRGLLAGIAPLEAKIKLLDYKISRSNIISPLNGTVLTKYAYSGEITSLGKPLFKIANLDSLLCRAYVSENQLDKVVLGAKASVFIDSGNDTKKEFKGRVTWISDKAEFTPKVIQTKEQRINLVYAVKILVPNEGSLKIGMPARVKFLDK